MRIWMFLIGWPDMVQMNIVNDPELIANIKLRYSLQNFYTYMDKSLISWQFIIGLKEGLSSGVRISDDIASLRSLNEYKMHLQNKTQAQLSEIPPHMFSMVFLAFEQAASVKKAQQIVLSGQSGSGKSSNIRACLKLLTKVRDDTASVLEESIMSAYKFLNLLGTARNSANPFSTRYSVNFRFYVNQMTRRVIAADLQPFFIESSRLHNLFQGKESFQLFNLFRTLNHPLVAQYPLTHIVYQPAENEDDYSQFFANLPRLGFSSEEVESILRVGLAVAELCASTPRTKQVTSLLGIQNLPNKQLLLFSHSSNLFLLASTLYRQLFFFVCTKLSAIMRAPLKDIKQVQMVQLLETCGFELTPEPQFESFLTNYAAEKIEQLLVQDMFKNMQADLQAEKMHDLAKTIEFRDNTEVISLFETTLFPRIDSDPLAAFSKVQSTCLKIDSGMFVIQHSFGDVAYKPEHFQEKHQCMFGNEFADLLQSSSFKTISDMSNKTEDAVKALNNFRRQDQSYHFVKCLRVTHPFNDAHVLQQLKALDAHEIIKFVKTNYPQKLSYNDFYQKYHQLDPMNKKISLDKHLRMDTDMSQLIREMNKRLFPSHSQRTFITGKQFLYLKVDTGYKLDSLMKDWNKKMDQYARKIQGQFKAMQFKKKMLDRVRRLSNMAKQNPQLKGQLANIGEAEEQLLASDPVKFVEIRQQQASKQENQSPQKAMTQTANQQALAATEELKSQQAQEQDELSDKEAYSLLTENQKQIYLKKKLELKQQKMMNAQQGQIVLCDEEESLSYQILTQEQKKHYQQMRIQKGYAIAGKQAEVFDISDSECYALLTETQKESYSKKKKEQVDQKKLLMLQGKFAQEVDDTNEGVAYQLLSEEQREQRVIKMKKKEEARKCEEMEALIAEEGFISDPDAFFVLTPQQKESYIEKKKEQRLFAIAGDEDQVMKGSLALSMLTPQQQREVKKIKKEKQAKMNEAKKLQAMEAYLSDCEAYAVLTEQQKQQYKEIKLERMLHPELAQVEDEPLAFSLLSEKQKEERRVLKIKRAIAEKQGAKARFAVEEEISDCESYAQLTEIQKTNYAKAKQDKMNIEKEKNALKYGYEGIISDPESFVLLTEEQKSDWTQKKKESEQVKMARIEARTAGVEGISDSEGFALLTEEQRQVYIKRKLERQEKLKAGKPVEEGEDEFVVATLLTAEQRELKEKKFHEKLEVQKAMDETGITPLLHNNYLQDSIAYAILTQEQKEERKVKQQKLEKQRREKLDSGVAVFEELQDSVAFAQLSVLQREDRKRKELTKYKMKKLLNPVLYAEEIDGNVSIAYTLLTGEQKDELYRKEKEEQERPQGQDLSGSVAFRMLNENQKAERVKIPSKDGGVDSELSDHELTEVKTLEEKKQRMKMKIEQLERDKFQFAVAQFSDYEAFQLLDEGQKQEYRDTRDNKDNPPGISAAYSLLDDAQKKKLRKRKQRKRKQKQKKAKRQYGIEAEISDLDSFLMLGEKQKQEYSKQKSEAKVAQTVSNQTRFGVDCDLSDEVALVMLNEQQLQEWRKQKQKKMVLQQEVKRRGFVVEFGDEPEDACIMNQKDYDENEKLISKNEKSLIDEERKLEDDLRHQEQERLIQQKKQSALKKKAQRQTLFKRGGYDPSQIKSDDFKTRGLDVWAMESTLYMKTIAEADYKKDSFIEKLLENPDLSPYVIAKTQKGKRLLDCNSAIHVPHETPALDEYDLAFLEQVRKCSFLTYCDKRIFRNKQFSKKTEIAKIMKYTSDKLEEPLTDINQIFHDRAKEMFRSLLKVGLFKRSRYTPKQHAIKIITALLGGSSVFELPQPPQKYLRNNADDFEEFSKTYASLVKEKFLEGDSDDEKDKKGKPVQQEQRLSFGTKKDANLLSKFNEYDQNKSLEDRVKVTTTSPFAQFREECYLQLFKQLGQNKTKEQVNALLVFGITISNLCAPTADGILPMLNFLLDHLEKEKVYKEAETNKLARQFFRNLAHQQQSIMLQNQSSSISQVFPTQIDPANLAKQFASEKGESQLNEKSKAMLAKIRIYRTSKEPMIQKLYRIQQGLSAASDIQYYQLQNVLPRKYLPSDDEMQLMENLRQVIVKVHLFSETPIWVQIGHNWCVHEVRDQCCRFIQKEAHSGFFGLYLIVRENSTIQQERYLDDDEKFLDVLNQMEFLEKCWTDQYKQNKSFQIYLRIRVYYRLFRIDMDSVNLFYFQLAYEVRQNRYPITPSDALLLGAMELYQKHNRYSAGNPETVKEKLEKLVEHLIPSKLVNGSFQEIRQRYHNEILPTYTNKEWANYILEQYRDFSFDSKVQARWEYISILRYYDLFLSSQFLAQHFVVTKDQKGTMRKSPTIECILALRPLHVVVADYPARKMLKTIHYFDVSSWGKNEQGQNYFFVRTEEGAVSIFEFTDRTLADYLLNSYINWSLGKPIDSHLCQEFNDILTFLVEKNE